MAPPFSSNTQFLVNLREQGIQNRASTFAGMQLLVVKRRVSKGILYNYFPHNMVSTTAGSTYAAYVRDSGMISDQNGRNAGNRCIGDPHIL